MKVEHEYVEIQPIRMAARIEKTFSNRIFVEKELTDTLQLRAIRKSYMMDTNGEFTTEFVCGLDIFQLKNGSSIVVSTNGIW